MFLLFGSKITLSGSTDSTGAPPHAAARRIQRARTSVLPFAAVAGVTARPVGPDQVSRGGRRILAEIEGAVTTDRVTADSIIRRPNRRTDFASFRPIGSSTEERRLVPPSVERASLLLVVYGMLGRREVPSAGARDQRHQHQGRAHETFIARAPPPANGGSCHSPSTRKVCSSSSTFEHDLLPRKNTHSSIAW